MSQYETCHEDGIPKGIFLTNFFENTKKVLEMISHIHVRTISAASQQPRKDILCFEIVQDISPFFDIYELLLESYSSLHIFRITVTRLACI